MKRPVNVLSIIALIVTGITSCEKSDDKKCGSCDLEGVEICEVDGYKVGVFDLPSDISFKDAVS